MDTITKILFIIFLGPPAFLMLMIVLAIAFGLIGLLSPILCLLSFICAIAGIFAPNLVGASSRCQAVALYGFLCLLFGAMLNPVYGI